MDCSIDTSCESDDATSENIGSSPGAGTRDPWKCDLCVEGCEIICRYRNPVHSLKALSCRNQNG